MKTFVSFDDQDTAVEFCRILRNLERYQIIREITGGTRLSNSHYVVGYKTGRWGCANHVVNLLHKGNGAVRVTIGRIDDGHPCEVLSTVSATDSFVESQKLREAIQGMAYLVCSKGMALREKHIQKAFQIVIETEIDIEVKRTGVPTMKWELLPYNFSVLSRL